MDDSLGGDFTLEDSLGADFTLEDSIAELLSLEREINALLTVTPFPYKLLEGKVVELISIVQSLPPRSREIGEWSAKLSSYMEKLGAEEEPTLPQPAPAPPAAVQWPSPSTANECTVPVLIPEPATMKFTSEPSTSKSTATVPGALFDSFDSPAGGEYADFLRSEPNWEEIQQQFDQLDVSASSLEHYRLDLSPAKTEAPASIPGAFVAPAPPITMTQETDTAARKEQIWAAFSNLAPVRSPTDMTGFRKLLTLSAKVKKYIEPLGGKCPFYEELLQLALDKMPPTSRFNFTEKEGEKAHLGNLTSYLFSLIKADADSKAAYSADEYSQLFTCSYCKCPGHNVSQCASRKATFCSNCFQFGHSAKRCPEETVTADAVQF